MLLGLAALLLSPTQAPAISFAPSADSTVVHSFDVNVAIGAMKARMKYEVTTTYLKVTDAEITLKRLLSNSMLSIEEKEISPKPTNAEMIVMDRNGAIDFVQSSPRKFGEFIDTLMLRFVPSKKEMGKRSIILFRGNGEDCPDQKVESTYTGPKKAKEGEGFGFKQKTTARAIVIDAEYVVKADGTVLHADIEFSGFPAPGDAVMKGTATIAFEN